MDLWDKLEERLRAVANNKANGGCDGVALICINLLFDDNAQLTGWYKPQRIPLEPKSFDVSVLIAGQRRLQGWEDVISKLKITIPVHKKLDKSLVVLNGSPVGFLIP